MRRQFSNAKQGILRLFDMIHGANLETFGWVLGLWQKELKMH